MPELVENETEETSGAVEEQTDSPEEPTEDAAEEQPDEDELESYPAKVVKDLRAENARYRTRAKAADDLAQRLHTELVRSTGKLADPADLPFDELHLEDVDALSAAIDALTESKPHLKARRIAGDIGQGVSGSQPEPVNLAALLRQRA